MPASWERALEAYRYPVNLADFTDAGEYPGWFEYNTGTGDLSETTALEDRFRELAPNHLEAWYEVVYWKMYSQNKYRRDKTTRNVINRLECLGVTAKDLWSLCSDYMESQNLAAFRNLRKKLFKSRSIATAATFPAFLNPDVFPMVDTQVARWVKSDGSQHSYVQSGVSLSEAPEITGSKTVLTESDWKFVESWVEWCRFTASRLTELTEHKWRVRDVEMAVFTAQRGGLNLNPLGG